MMSGGPMLLLPSVWLVWLIAPTLLIVLQSSEMAGLEEVEVDGSDQVAVCRVFRGSSWRREKFAGSVPCQACLTACLVYSTEKLPASEEKVRCGTCRQPDYFCRVEYWDHDECVAIERREWHLVAVVCVIPALLICTAIYWYMTANQADTAEREKEADRKRHIKLVQDVAFRTKVKTLDNAIEARVRFDLKKERPHMGEEAGTTFTDGIMKTVHSSTTFWLSVLWWVQGQVKVDSIHVERLLYKYHAWQAQKSISRLPRQPRPAARGRRNVEHEKPQEGAHVK